MCHKAFRMSSVHELWVGTLKVVAIGGSTRARSSTQLVLGQVADALRERGLSATRSRDITVRFPIRRSQAGWKRWQLR
jgi:hypothetical protein